MAEDIVECAIYGDAVLVVGTGESTRKIKVDTHILKSVSETFKAMFGHQWSDGQNLSYVTPKEVLFPDDDPGAMEAICRILHHKYHPKRGSVDAAQLLTLARTVDKYFLQKAMAFAGDVLLRSIATEDPQVLIALLHAAFLFENVLFIKELCKMLVIHCAEDYNLLMGPDTPQELLDLRETMSRTRQRYHDQFHYLVLDVFTFIPKHYRSPCECLSAYSKALYTYISDQGLIPIEQDIHPKSIHTRIKLMQDFPTPSKDQFQHSGDLHKRSCATPLDMYQVMRRELDALASSITTMDVM